LATYGFAATNLDDPLGVNSEFSSSPLIQNKQVITINGSVKDTEGVPLIGATVQLKSNLNLVAIVDADGKYTLHVPSNEEKIVLVVSYVGMEQKEVHYKGQKILNIFLESSEQIDNVVVTGYLKLKKNSFTGNATVVKKEELLLTNNKNAIAALQSFDPSFRLKEQAVWGSDPNKMPEFTIRGESSLGRNRGLDTELSKRDQRAGLTDNPNLPIFILDGFEVSVQKIYDMDINRIESMTILKDAAATALYGSRASNGVIVVTTIAPKPGEIRVNYNFSAGAEFPDLSDYNLCNAEEMLQAEKLSGKYTSESGDPGVQIGYDIQYNDLVNEVRRGVRTDWLAQPLRNVFNQTHSLNFSGGVESIRYSVDLGYITGNGAMRGSYRNRYNAGLTIDYRLKEWLQIMNSISYGVTKMEDSPYGDFSAYTRYKPYWTPFDNDGNLVPTIADQTNPLYKAKYLGSYRGRGSLSDLTNNLSLNIYILDGLSFRSQLSVTKTDTESETFEDPKDPMFKNTPSKEKGSLSLSGTSGYNWNINSMLYYNKSIKKHFLNTTFGANVMESNSSSSYIGYKGFQLSNLNAPAYAAISPTKPTISNSKTRLIGWLGSLNYSYDNIYLVDASIRFDGSSRFGKDKRFAPFWSIGLGMNIHNYEWLKDSDIISMLRWRCTYGITGNVSFPPYAAISTYKTSDDWYYSSPANTLIALGNPKLTWEKTNTWDYGISLGLFENRVTLDANYYRKETNNQLSQLNIRTSSGFSTFYTNAGTVLNKGYELRLNVVALRTKDWTLTLNGTMAANKNTITALGQEAEAYNKNIQDFHNGNYNGDEISGVDYSELMYIPLTQYYIGASTTAIYAVPSLGIDPSTGKELFLKRDGTVTHTWNAQDEVVCGDTSPKAQGAFSVNVGWKGFYANLSFLYQWGAQSYNETLLQKVEQADINGGNVDRRVLTDRWQKPGDAAPFYNLKSKIKTQPTSRFIQDDNRLSFSGLALGYDFSQDLIKKWKLSSLGIRFNANDVLRWTSIREERGTSYPYAKNYSFTLSVGF
jgi:TonB-linked outer membrane protein, SusC/RagA family/TonB-dependent outer membrane receptor, SusC/RagA subfamily, signature region